MNPIHTRPEDSGFVLRPQARRKARAREATPRTICQVVPLKDEQGFALALVRTLDRSIPEVEFRVVGQGSADWLWVCGFEPGDFGRVTRMRAAFGEPVANGQRKPRLLVTGRNLSFEWRTELVRAGIDQAVEWPCPLDALREMLVQGS